VAAVIGARICLIRVAVLITRAVRADDRDALAERYPPSTSQPAWVGPN
jgi:hypothetical protein